MPRTARAVFAGVPHHITQRGNRSGQVFFSNHDRRAYLKWLRHYSRTRGTCILAYCLMPNHVHLVAVPEDDQSLHLTLKPLHMLYAQRVNRARDWRGHLWQGRYFSCPLDERHTWAAVRYVERNPVRAGLSEHAEDYEWSSARVRCRGGDDLLLWEGFPDKADRPQDWAKWLAGEQASEELHVLRRNTQKGLPCGSGRFVAKLERLAGRALMPGPVGRPPKKG